jgi:hypothetical protein
VYSHKRVSGEPEKEMIKKENNFQQASGTVRSWDCETGHASGHVSVLSPPLASVCAISYDAVTPV